MMHREMEGWNATLTQITQYPQDNPRTESHYVIVGIAPEVSAR